MNRIQERQGVVHRRTLICLLGAAAILVPSLCPAQAPPKYNIRTVAGNGADGSDGDGGQATAAKLYKPYGVALDGSGNLYIADQVNNKIRKVAADGTISTVAGKGTKSFSGDGGSASSAELSSPSGVVVDSSGNIYISDSTSNRVRKVASGGTISTFAGSDTPGTNGDGDAANKAQLDLPTGLALDSSGNLYIADTNNNRIRKVGTDGKISTVAGTGAADSGGDGGPATSAQLNHPTGVAVGPGGSIYIADQMNHKIRKITPDGTITTIAGKGFAGYSGNGGAAVNAGLSYPSGVSVDASGNVFIADTINNRIRMVVENQTISTVAGNGKFGAAGDDGPAAGAQLNFPVGVLAASGGKVYIVDAQNSKIRLLTPVQEQGNAVVPPSIADGGVVSATAYGAFTEAAPGSWVDILGYNLASSTRDWSAADFDGVRAPTTLEGTRVNIAGQAAFLSYVSPNHLRAQLPSSVRTGMQEVTVTTAAGTSTPYSITVNPTQPGLYAPSSFIAKGKQYAAALLPDGKTYAMPADAISGLASRPARPGETLTLYGVGFGAVTPNVDAGETTQGHNSLTLPVFVKFGDSVAAVTYAGLDPGQVGVYKFTLDVPAMADNSAVPLTMTLGGAPIGQTLFVAVQNSSSADRARHDIDVECNRAEHF